MNVSAQGIGTDQPEQPQDEQDDEDCPKHGILRFRNSDWKLQIALTSISVCVLAMTTNRSVSYATPLTHTVDSVHALDFAGTGATRMGFVRLRILKIGAMGFGGVAMRKDELLKADLLSEIVLIVSGVAILLTLGIVVVAALTSTTTGMQ
jgi:hypothetical protein